MYRMTFLRPWPKVIAVALIDKNLLVCINQWEPLNQSLPFFIISDVFFKVKHSIGHISGMVGPIDVKRKEGASVGYWVNYVTSILTSPIALTIDFSRPNFKIAVSQELLADWCETKMKHINSLQSCHSERDGASNHQPHRCLLNRLFRRGSKKTSKPRVTDLCAGNSPVTGDFAAQMASNAEMFPFDGVII